MVNALSVDVEEYYHAAIFRAGAPALVGRPLESRVERSTDAVLTLFARHRTRATFFVLGEIAAVRPAVVRRIAAERHEVACHGYRHENVDGQTPRQFRADIRQAKARLEDLTGARVLGYRAPNFSIGVGQSWAHDILLEEGFAYDSSIYPILHDRYGQPQAPRFPYEVRRHGPLALVEFPVGTVRLAGVNLPIGGGGYFRLYPFGLTRFGIRRVNTRDRQPIMFYFHPWELDPGQPRPPMAWHHRFRHYVGMGRETLKLSRLLAEFRFAAACDVLGLPPGAAITAPRPRTASHRPAA